MLPYKNLIFFLVFIVGGICLQIFLSKRENKWLGLILPLITFAFSLLALINLMYTGNVIGFILQALVTIVLFNIPTFILLAIYSSCREKIKKKSQLDKMNIMDLD